jgi:uncharacterized protein YbjT (DUF2867 family)
MKALLVGASGLIGKQLLHLLLQDSYYDSIITFTRHPLNVNHPKLTNIVIDFDRLTEHYSSCNTNHVFCCLGTTIKQAKSKEAFRKVDYEYPVEIARMTKSLGADKYLLVSALGADKKSAIFYNQTKGETEAAIEAIGFNTLHIFQPSLLLGNRDEGRSGEDAAKIVYKFFGFLIPKKYKALDSAKVARAMLVYAKENKMGTFIHPSAALQHF